MMVIRNILPFALTLAIGMAIATPATAADERLSKAKDLYRSASYDEALAVLDTLPSTGASADTAEAGEYRVYCLVALDRRDDAMRAIAALVTADPSFRISESQASPRVRAVFKEVRQSLLPSLVQHAYAEAKAAFDSKDARAASQFEKVLALLRDPDLTSTPALADLVTVATAFRDLSKALETAQAPPPAPAPSRPTAPVPSRPTAAAVVQRSAAISPISAAGNPNVIPPVAVSQSVPMAQVLDKRVWDGAVEIVIDQTGRVISARVTESIFPSYDKQLVRAAMTWTYRPALKDGVPTPYTKVIKVHVDTRPDCSGQSAGPCRQPGAE